MSSKATDFDQYKDLSVRTARMALFGLVIYGFFVVAISAVNSAYQYQAEIRASVRSWSESIEAVVVRSRAYAGKRGMLASLIFDNQNYFFNGHSGRPITRFASLRDDYEVKCRTMLSNDGTQLSVGDCSHLGDVDIRDVLAENQLILATSVAVADLLIDTGFDVEDEKVLERLAAAVAPLKHANYSPDISLIAQMALTFRGAMDTSTIDGQHAVADWIATRDSPFSYTTGVAFGKSYFDEGPKPGDMFRSLERERIRSLVFLALPGTVPDDKIVSSLGLASAPVVGVSAISAGVSVPGLGVSISSGYAALLIGLGTFVYFAVYYAHAVELRSLEAGIDKGVRLIALPRLRSPDNPMSGPVSVGRFLSERTAYALFLLLPMLLVSLGVVFRYNFDVSDMRGGHAFFFGGSSFLDDSSVIDAINVAALALVLTMVARLVDDNQPAGTLSLRTKLVLGAVGILASGGVLIPIALNLSDKYFADFGISFYFLVYVLHATIWVRFMLADMQKTSWPFRVVAGASVNTVVLWLLYRDLLQPPLSYWVGL